MDKVYYLTAAVASLQMFRKSMEEGEISASELEEAISLTVKDPITLETYLRTAKAANWEIIKRRIREAGTLPKEPA